MANSRLPPVTTLRAFEAAARHESFAHAADELHVTPGAVSHQIRALESFVGVPLFQLVGRGVVLTADGRFFAERVRTALEMIADAAARIARRRGPIRLTISVTPSLGSRWLMPRIGRFIGRHPGWEVNVETTPALANFAADGVDVAIRYGRGPWPGLHQELLMNDEYIMVASPLYNGGRLPAAPSELGEHILLRTTREEWALWMQVCGIQLPRPEAGVDFTDSGLMLQGALDGEGILLTRRRLAEDSLSSGALVQVFPLSAPCPESYHIVWPEQGDPPVTVRAFRDWLVSEVAADDRGPKSAH